MLKSMTGYGRREAVTEGKKILVEIKSVNHRYSDYNIKDAKTSWLFGRIKSESMYRQV